MQELLPTANEIELPADVFCRVCGTTGVENFSIKYRKPGYVITVCQNCNFHFIPEQIKPDVDYSTYKTEDTIQQVKIANQWLKIERNKLRYSLIKKFKRSGLILDVGAGYGHFLITGRMLGYEVEGIEMSKGQARFIREEFNIPVFEGSILEAEGEGKYDILTFWDVLEHISEADEVLRKVYSLLKPGGIVVIQVPEMGSFASRMLKEKWWEMSPEHVNLFSRHTLSRLLESVGFEVKKVKATIELKNVFSDLIVPRLKKRPSNQISSAERQEAFNKATNRPKWMLKTLVFFHNIVYRTLSAFGIGDDMIVIAAKPVK